MKPLTVEELKALHNNDWIWVVSLQDDFKPNYELIVANTEDVCVVAMVGDRCEYIIKYSDYGKTWLAYKNKELAEAKGEIVELPCKFGDMVYEPCVERNRILVGEVKRIHYDKQVGYESYFITASCGDRDENLPWQEQVLGFSFNPFTDWNVSVFGTYNQAEARLKELRGSDG